MFEKLSKFIQQSRYVLKLARKPTREEFVRTAKITGLGILTLGLIGYVFQFVYMWLTGLGRGGV